MTNTEDNKIIITIIGADKIGIVAKITAILAECKVNIEDIKQSIMQNIIYHINSLPTFITSVTNETNSLPRIFSIVF